MFLKLISQRKAWSLQKCWVPYKHWGNVYIICAKKIAQIKPGVCRVQTPRNYWETIYIFWYYFIPRNMLYNSAGGALSNAIQEVPVHLRGFSHQQLNNKLMTHILQLLLVQTLNKSVQKRFFCWVSNFEHFEAIIHLVFYFFIWPLTMQLIYKTYYIWNDLNYISLYLSRLDNVISNFCTVWTCSKKFKQPVITLDLETWFTGLSVQTVYVYDQFSSIAQYHTHPK